MSEKEVELHKRYVSNVIAVNEKVMQSELRLKSQAFLRIWNVKSSAQIKILGEERQPSSRFQFSRQFASLSQQERRSESQKESLKS